MGTGAYSSSQLVNVSYQNSNKVAFDDNTYRYQVVKRNMDNLFTVLYSRGIMSSRYDLVGHSMGGILSRKYAQEINAQHVNRIITFDTPHSGSQMANIAKTIHISELFEILDELTTEKLDVKGTYNAYRDLMPNSEAVTKLNDPSLMANAMGIPVHAACTAFDGADDNLDILSAPVDAFLSVMPLTPYSLLWFARLSYRASEGIINLSNKMGLDMISTILHDSQHDGIVSLVSQTGGLDVSSAASLLTAKYEGNGGFGSPAHHCNMTKWDLNHRRLISLLTAKKDDPRFASGFAPADLSNQVLPMKSPAKTEASEGTEIHITVKKVDTQSRVVNLTVTATPEVKAIGAFCVLDEERGIFTDVDADGHATMTIPEDVKGWVEFFGVGKCENGAWVADVARLSFNSTIEPENLSIINANPIVIAKGQSVEVQVAAEWNDGTTNFVKPSFEIVEGNGIAEINDGIITGKTGGECKLVASYRGLTDSIAVNVIDDFSGIDEIKAETEGEIRMFTRERTVVAQFIQGYNGDIDIELYNVNGQLIGRTSSGGVFDIGDELLYILPSPAGQVYAVRCKTDNGTYSMKLIY